MVARLKIMLRGLLRLLTPVLISLLLLFILARMIDVDHTLTVLRRIDMGSLLVAIAATAVYFALGAVRFTWLLQPLAAMPLRQSLALNFVMVLFAHVMGIITDLFRIRYLARSCRLTIRDAIFASVADRLLSVWLLFASLATLLPWVVPIRIVFYGAAAIAAGLALGWFLVRRDFWPRWLQPAAKLLAYSLRNPAALLRQYLCALAGVICVGVTLSILAAAMHIPVDPAQLLAFSPLALLASIIPFTYVGLGARETAFTAILPLMTSVSPEQALALSLGLGLCYLLACLPALLLVPGFIRAVARPS